MSAPRLEESFCQSCPDPEGGFTRYKCVKDGEADIRDEFIASAKAWLDRARTVAPGLTNVEVAVVERLIEDLEAS